MYYKCHEHFVLMYETLTFHAQSRYEIGINGI